MPRKTFREIVDALTSSPKPLRGSAKLAAALDAFNVDVNAKTCLDIGASTGGFTSTLLEHGARRVYAVDAGHGQLLGSLRQNERVVNLESTNVAELDDRLIPDVVDIVTIDVSYLALRDAVAQLDRIRFASDAELVGLVKPMFELALASAPSDEASLLRAIEIVRAEIVRSRWVVRSTLTTGIGGARGAVEGFVHAAVDR